MESSRLREIVHIDEELCDGCGLCIPSCAEGAIALVGGKARLVADRFCDGLGNCLGSCPRGAIRIERRPAEEYDDAAVAARQAALRVADAAPAALAPAGPADSPAAEACGCPGAAARRLRPATRSCLGHWPVQLHLLPVAGEMWREADVLVAADCVGFALPDFHERLLEGRTLAVGCPKLDDIEIYVRKLTEILRRNRVRSLAVARMEVPCCAGLVSAVKRAAQAAGRDDLAIREITVGTAGDVRDNA